MSRSYIPLPSIACMAVAGQLYFTLLSYEVFKRRKYEAFMFQYLLYAKKILPYLMIPDDGGSTHL
jgi:hypothetical protein